MKSEPVSSKIFNKKTNDFTFAIMFFLIFSIFIFFAIRPSLAVAFSLRKEEDELRRIDSLYEKKIAEIVTIQYRLEKGRDKLYMLDQAIPSKPELNKLLKDLDNISFSNIKKTAIGEAILVKEEGEDLLKLKINLEAGTDFETVLRLIKDLINQRRLKTIQKMIIGRDAVGTQSGQLKIIMEVEAYYL